MKFISNEEWKALSEQKDETLVNEILSRVFNSAVESAIRQLPEVVSRMVASTAATKAMTNKFLDRNKEFKDHQRIVTLVLQDIESKNADWDYEKILEEAEPIIKEKIKAEKEVPALPMDKPENVKPDANGVL